jgi:hypothetical protein
MSIITRTQKLKDKHLIWIDTGNGNTEMIEVDNLMTEKQAQSWLASRPVESVDTKIAEIDKQIVDLQATKATLVATKPTIKEL